MTKIFQKIFARNIWNYGTQQIGVSLHRAFREQVCCTESLNTIFSIVFGFLVLVVASPLTLFGQSAEPQADSRARKIGVDSVVSTSNQPPSLGEAADLRLTWPQFPNALWDYGETISIPSYRRASTVERLDTRTFPAGVAQRTAFPESRATDFEFDSIDLAELQGWLNWFRIEVPVDIQGDLSGWLWVQRSDRGFLDFSGYRLEGGIQSRSMSIDQWVITSANFRFGYVGEHWYVGDLSGTVRTRDSGAAIGYVTIQALLPPASNAETASRIRDEAKLELSVSLENFSLLNLLANFGLTLPATETRGTAELALQVPVDSFSDLQGITGWIDLNSGDLKVEKYPAAKLTGRVFTESGLWIAPMLEFAVAENLVSQSRSTIQLVGSGRTSDKFQFQSSFRGDGVDAATLIVSAQPDHEVQGLLEIEGRVEGNAHDGIQSAVVRMLSESVSMTQVQLSDLDVRAVLNRSNYPQLALQLAPTTILAKSARRTIPVGSAEGFVSWRLMEDVTFRLPSQTHLSIDRLDLSRIPPDLLPLPLAGTLRLLVNWEPRTDANIIGERSGTGDSDGLQSPSIRDWNLRTELSVNGLQVQNVNVGDVGLRADKPLDSRSLKWSFSDRGETVQASGTAILRDVGATGPILDDTTETPSTTEADSDADPLTLYGVALDSYFVGGHFTQFILPLSILPDRTGQLRLTGDFTARGAGVGLPEQANADLAQLQFAIDDLALTLSNAIIAVTPQSIELKQFTLADESGSISGAAVLKRKANQQHTLNISADGLNLTPYLNSIVDVPWAMESSFMRAQLTKSSSSDLVSDLSAFGGWSGRASGEISNVVYSGAPLGFIRFDVLLDDRVLQGTATGELLGGSLELEATLPARILEPAAPQPKVLRTNPTDPTPSNVDRGQGGPEKSLELPPLFMLTSLAPAEGEPVAGLPMESKVEPDAASSTHVRLSVAGVDFRRLMGLFAAQRLIRDYGGVISLDATVTPDDGAKNGWRMSAGNLRLRAPHLTYQRQILTRDLTIDASWDDLRISITRVRGTLAGGHVAVEGNLRLPEQDGGLFGFVPQGVLHYSANRIELQKLMYLVAPDYANRIVGRFSSRGQIRCRDAISVLGSSHLSDASIYSIPIQKLRNDLHLSIGIDGSFQQLTAHRIRGDAIGGKTEGSATIRGGDAWGLESELRIRNGKLEQLSRSLGFEHIVGTGGFDFVAALEGKDVFDLQTLQGPVQIDFRNADAQSVPILTDLSRFVPLVQLANTDITGGFLHGQVGQGQLRILDVFLNSDAYMLMGSGSYGLLSGRLDLETILQTGGGLDRQVAQAVSQKFVAVALPQLLLLTELNDLIRNRTLYFHIGGTAGQPVIQPRAIRTVGRAFLQNLRRRLLVIPATATAFGNNSH